jgi:probable rRNA maturation factor
MEVNVFFDTGFEDVLAEVWLRAIAGKVLEMENQPDAEMGLVITGQEKISQLNEKYLGHEGPTDVLAFALNESPGEVVFPVPEGDSALHLGEVIISYPQARKQADGHRHSIKTEVAILVIHGTLHLLGYDHGEPEDKKKMHAREKVIRKWVAENLV